ncbi:MAG: Ku protein, partial [Anaerolineae bacterium]|nr:Ku protein [Anaerolineae bacterium]
PVGPGLAGRAARPGTAAICLAWAVSHLAWLLLPQHQRHYLRRLQAMRASWTGAINFGLVSIPVRLYRAVEERHVRFRYLHRVCRTPLAIRRYCPYHEDIVPWEEVARGFEVAPDQYIIVEEQELEEAAADTTHRHTIDIRSFVDLAEIDPIYFDTSYYAEPRPEASPAYAVLQQAMLQTARAAVATMLLRTRETLVAIRPYQDVLVVQTLYFAEEVLSPAPLDVPREAVPPRELRTAIRLIENMAEPFAAQHYADEYHRRLMSLIDEKAAQLVPAWKVEGREAQEGRLTSDLEASIEAVKQSRRESE